MESKKIELLAPAGSYESFVAAIEAGADAVYVGGSRFGARAYAKNFTEEELLRAVDYAHLHGRKVYLTVNTLMKETEIKELPEYLEPYYLAGLDAVIVQDIGAVSVIRNCFPNMPVHASTQMTITAKEGVLLMQELGVEQVVPARELSLKELKQISEHTDVQIECFIHGAICYSYSGKCLFSSLIGGRSGNRGRCAQPCRLPYDIEYDGKKLNREGEQYILSLKDMCTIELIPDMIEAGITSFKIEGRMKRPEYVAGVTRMYRKYIDRYLNLAESQNYYVERSDYEELRRLYTRSGSSEGYYLKKNGRDMLSLKKPSYETDDADAFSKLYDTYVNHAARLPASMRVMLKKNEPARLQLHTENAEVEVLGEIVSKALNRPLDHESILKQLNKMGNTLFELTQIDVEAEEDIFMPVKQLNELRRQGIEQLMEVLTASYRREKTTKGDFQVHGRESVESVEMRHNPPYLTASVESFELLKSLCMIEEIKRIYLSYADIESIDAAIRMVHDAGKEVYLALPVICRHYEGKKRERLLQYLNRSEVAGVSVQNYEWLYLLQQIKYQGDILSDYYLYAMNTPAREQLRRFGCRHFTMPLELNEREIRQLDRTDCEMPIYGSIPMMVTAQCIMGTLKECVHQKVSGMMLKDRYQKKLHVKNCCSECYNVIYNSVPLSLHNELSKIKSMGFESLRLGFTDEKPEDALQIAKWYAAALYKETSDMQPPVTEFTKGHFSRGVE